MRVASGLNPVSDNLDARIADASSAGGRRREWGEDFAEGVRAFWNGKGGPRFLCGMLVGTSCEDPDDWEVAFGRAHDFEKLKNMSLEPVFVLPARRKVMT